MGTIVEKSEYLTETKDKIKESINNLGGDITNETTFREYAQELDNIYDNLPKTTGEGTNLSLTTLKGKMNIIPKGDTQQTTYSGYNLLDINNVSVSTEKASYTKNETGYDITTNSQASSTSYGRIVITTSFIDSSKNYGVSFDITSNVAGNYMAGWIGASKTTTGNVSTNTKKHVFVTLTGITTTAFSLAFYAANASVKVENLQIYEGTTDKDYEPFVGGIASPNPSYPQNIEVVTGEQDVKVENKNLLEGIELGDINSQTGAESTSTSVLRGTNYIRYFTNTDYFPSVNGNLIASGSVINLRFYNKDKQYIGYATLLRTGGRNFNITITTSVVDTTPYYFRIRTTTSVAKTTDNVMISYSSDTTYVEHQEQTQIVSLGDIELCKIGNYQDYLYKSNDKWYKKEYIYKIANKTNWAVGNIGSNNRCAIGLVANGYADASSEGYANINGYSNYFSGISQANQATTTNINNIAVNNSNIYIKFADTINTRELAKAQLDSMTGLVIYYGLATPNDIEITNTTLIEQLDNLEKLKSYNGTTNISSSGNLPMILSVSALKGE